MRQLSVLGIQIGIEKMASQRNSSPSQQLRDGPAPIGRVASHATRLQDRWRRLEVASVGACESHIMDKVPLVLAQCNQMSRSLVGFVFFLEMLP